MFYTGDRVRFGGLLDAQSPLLPAVAPLKAPLEVEQNFPLWFIAFGMTPTTLDTLNFYTRPHLEGGKHYFGKSSVKWLKPSREARLKPAFWGIFRMPHPPPEGGGKEEPAQAG